MNRLLKKLEKIGRDPKVTAKAVGLRYVSDSTSGYTRKKSGKGWGFYNTDGKLVKDKELIDRFNKLVIPPAYTTCGSRLMIMVTCNLPVLMLQAENNTDTTCIGTRSVINRNITDCNYSHRICQIYVRR